MKSIIIVDMQKGFITQNNLHLVEKINNYLQNNKFDNVIYTKCINYNNSPYVKFLNWTGMMTEEEQSICVTKIQNSLVLNKSGYGLSFKQLQQIKNLKIEQIEICGTDIDACVMAIAYQLFDFGIKPIILKDLCGTCSKNQDLIDYSLAIMQRSFGKYNVI